MDNKNSEDFILTLVGSLQSLCKGYVNYINEVQVTGQLYVSVDGEETTEYVVNEKLCKASNGKVDIISNSFYVEGTPTSNLENVNVKQELVNTVYSEVTNKVDPLLHVQSNASCLPLDKICDSVKGISTKIQYTGFLDQQNNGKTSCTPENNVISSNCSDKAEAALEGVKTSVSTQHQEYQADLAMTSSKEYNGL